MAVNTTFRGKVWEKSNGQKVVTIPSDQDIETGDTVRVAKLGKFHDMMSPENTPGHFIHEDLKSVGDIIRDSINDIPEDKIEEMMQDFNFMKAWEYDVSEGLDRMMEAVDETFGVVYKPENEKITHKRIFRHEVKTLADKLRELEEEKQEELSKLQEELGIEKVEWGNHTVEVDFGEGDIIEAKLPVDKEEYEKVAEYEERQDDIHSEYENKKTQTIRNEGFEFSIESRSRHSHFYNLEKDGFRTEITAFGPVELRKNEIKVEST